MAAIWPLRADDEHYATSISEVMNWLGIPLPHDKNTNFTRVRDCIESHIKKYFFVGSIANFRYISQHKLVQAKIISANGGTYTIDDLNGHTKVTDLRYLEPIWQ